jgi:hypothetical protein
MNDLRSTIPVEKARMILREPEATKPALSPVLESIADETHAKYGAELFAPRTRQELRDEADTMYRGGLLKKYLPSEAKTWDKAARYAYATNRALIAFLAGAELGMLPLQAVRGIYFVEDQPSPAAKTLVGLIKKRTTICEYWQVESSTATECQIVTKRRGTPKEERLKVTLDDFAKSWREEKNQYGSPKRPPWILWPSRQLHARCSSWLAGMVYQDITQGFYAAEEMSSAVWERKYADVSRAMVQVPAAVESDDVLDEMVGMANDGDRTEAPIVGGPEAPQEAPAKPVLDEAEYKALLALLPKVGDSITPEEIAAIERRVEAFAGMPVAHGKLRSLWTANGNLNPAVVAS